jgi:hypothetical protein
VSTMWKFDFEPSPPHGRVLRWALTGFYNEDTDTVFLPLAFAGMAEKMTWLCAGADHVPTFVHKKHWFGPAPWLAGIARENHRPDIAVLLERREQRIRKHHAAGVEVMVLEPATGGAP